LLPSSKIVNTTERTSNKSAFDTDGAAMHQPSGRPISLVKRFASLGLKEQVLLLRVLFLVSAIRLGLFVLPFRILRRFAQRGSGKSNTTHSTRQYVWAVRAVSRHVPGATCLTQALAAQALLARSGHKSRIEIGVRKDEQQGFLAHAWVVCGDQIVIGGAEAEGYLPLESWDTKSLKTDKT
jgi:hypothetical protein